MLFGCALCLAVEDRRGSRARWASRGARRAVPQLDGREEASGAALRDGCRGCGCRGRPACSWQSAAGLASLRWRAAVEAPT